MTSTRDDEIGQAAEDAQEDRDAGQRKSMKGAQRLYLVRHGENRANLTKEFSHRVVDYPLTEKGVVQAQQSAEHFRSLPVDAIYSSPLRRAVETAEIIAGALGLPVTVTESFREVNVGRLELTPPTEAGWAIYNDVIRGWIDGDAGRAFPDGEDYCSLLARMRQGLDEIAARPALDNVIIVGHGGIFTYTIRDICRDVNFNAILEQENNNCSITTIELCRDRTDAGRLVAWADHSHLAGEAAHFVSALPDK